MRRALLNKEKLRAGSCVGVLMLSAALGFAQSSFVTITPHTVTMNVGESRPFRMVDQDGQKQTNVAWSVSDAKALDASDGDEVTVAAKEAGEFHLTAKCAAGSDEIAITVVEAGTMKAGTIIWSEPALPGCKAVKMTQAMPSATGPDLYAESECEDGHYVAAYTANGIQLWRRKIGTPAGSAPPAPDATITVPSGPYIGMRMNVHAHSVCDSIAAGDSQRTTRALLQERNLSFSEANHAWTVEESGSKCTLWFDDKGLVVKKRKTLVAE
jgi:hypothetical protein